MTAIVYGFVRTASRDSDFAVIAAFSLAGIVMTLAAAHFGLDVSAALDF